MNLSSSHNMYHLISSMLKHIDSFVTIISILSALISFQPKWLHMNLSFSYNTSYHFNHVEAYRFIYNHVTLIFFHLKYYSFISTNGYICIYNLVTVHIISISSCTIISIQQFAIYIFKNNSYLSSYQYQSLYYIPSQSEISNLSYY